MMQRSFALIVLAGCLLPGGEAAAQGTPSRTFDGYDGPPSGPQANSPFLANIYGSGIEVVPRADTCGRPFYIQGVLTMAQNGRTGTIDGVMTRCTNPELFDCGHLINYEVSIQGDVTQTATGYSLQLRYTMEIWNKDTCKLDREERRTEQLELFELPQPAPTPPPTQRVNNTFNRGVRTFWDSFWTLGGLVQH